MSLYASGGVDRPAVLEHIDAGWRRMVPTTGSGDCPLYKRRQNTVAVDRGETFASRLSACGS